MVVEVVRRMGEGMRHGVTEYVSELVDMEEPITSKVPLPQVPGRPENVVRY
jgi:hypothetical protein